ncbi:N-acetylmuramoyl-L-alanine amidase [Thermoactinomyces sp. DSM 45892]|uniref:peptidoglycan recognition protein family protein n=1 Tax=Thermoactinomyces sp. DSM 45892 TaxID=1882753 RepID=UPI00089A63B9|nr:N-acetylmuramoyl-L-alanine amidase [Thermoactinomyces sp. DSM 45892]SDX96140.1 N-acetylmuramoyl-L-alanine amidase [Thermoactinomyces sp. DSM 45892]
MSVWQDKYIVVNSKSRPSFKLLGVRKLVIHYTANNGGTAMNHFNYFNNYRSLPRAASAHIFVDRTQALCIVPLNEVAYHANDKPSLIPALRATASYYKGGNANLTSIGVEMCMERNGTFHPDTISRTEDVFVELCRRYRLDPLTDIVRHYDITRKNCPAPWVSNPQAFTNFKNRVYAKLKGTVPPSSLPSTTSSSSDPILRKGSRSDAVKSLQSYLNKFGYNLNVDGAFGPLTQNAVKDFQRKNDLVVDGIVGEKTWSKLKSASPAQQSSKFPLPSVILKYGYHGSEVRQLQEALNEAGFSCGRADGVFGKKTLTALKSFQRSASLVVDGIYGNKTRQALHSKVNT